MRSARSATPAEMTVLNCAATRSGPATFSRTLFLLQRMTMKRWALLLILALVPATPAAAQSTGQITGVVTDATGAPVAGAAVAVQGTTRGDETSADGRFTITLVPAGAHQVKASKIGFAEQTRSATVAAGQSATVSFQLVAQVVQLEQVVAVGYGTARKQDVTGAVASVSSQEVKETPTPSVGEALKGRVAGVQVTTGGFTPGSNPTIRIRGVRSLTASNDPLIVVDGVAIAGGLGDINPGTIESIDVLKDASATAVYGSRGANGVVLISTKRGQAGKTQLTYETRYGVEQIHNKLKPFDGPEYAQFKRESFRTAGKYTCPNAAPQCDEADANLFSALELANLQAGNFTDYVQRLLTWCMQSRTPYPVANRTQPVPRWPFTGLRAIPNPILRTLSGSYPALPP